jgi:hypothetical protein
MNHSLRRCSLGPCRGARHGLGVVVPSEPNGSMRSVIRTCRCPALALMSTCAFPDLEDGDGAGFPGPGGAPPQNWGHRKDAFGTPQDAVASGFQPGDSCNGHAGFLVNPPPETP